METNKPTGPESRSVDGLATGPAPAPQPQPSSETVDVDAYRTTAEPAAVIAEEPRIAYQPPAQTHGLQRMADIFVGILAFIFSWFVFPVLIVLVLHNFVFQAYHVVGTSMINTLHPADYLIVSKLGDTKALIDQKTGKNSVYIPARGQIIVFHYPRQPDLIFVKRVIGLPGERVTVKNGVVTIYNKSTPGGFQPDSKGSYEAPGTATLSASQGDIDEVIPAGNVFVLGDNRSPGGSFDSRDWGDLPSSYIIGNAVLRLLPIDKVTVF